MERLQALCPYPLAVVWHENRTTYYSARKERGKLYLRLHRLFENAPSPVLEALIRMSLKKDPEARAIVRKMAHLYFSQNQAAPEPLPAQGEVYDLDEIFQEVKSAYFPALDLSIGWSRPKTQRFRFITFGVYDSHRRQIRINRLLDDPHVPRYFLEFIVYHEALHAVCPASIDQAGRCRVHTKVFRAKEKEFPHFQAAKEWEKQCLTFFKKTRRNINSEKVSYGRP